MASKPVAARTCRGRAAYPAAASLLLGLAGIGHFYLRLYDPANVPSVLIPRPRRVAELRSMVMAPPSPPSSAPLR
ncbi:hypothetical protein [Bradyrhizobium ivorense]|uniref:hypothetical protein n=1 Tax=Bradyrhizobium ivorense TaxID=2511166 RepID=UPI00111FB4E8|nr:hypothetical protein [Bradyrhizobium ivorense]MCC8937628.1 hypothetical protein [Bradyrhizobium ivorense]